MRRWFWPLLLVPTLLVGVWLRKEALDSAFLSDDYAQHAMLHDRFPVQRAAWDLYNFSDGTAAGTRPLIEAGFCPWWTHPGFKLRMLRPLPSLLHALDDQLMPGNARLQHLHSLLWWVLMVLAAAGLLAAALPRAAAACAVVLFALDDSHVAPLFWVANRNSLCAMAFACAALWAHVVWRRGGRSALRLLSIALFALALSAGEYGLTMAGYLVCFELLSSFDAGPSRLRALAPALAACALYLAVALGLGYGTAHSGLYTSPISDPVGYLDKLVFGVPLLLGDLVFGNSADMVRFDHSSHMRGLLSNFGILGALCLIGLIVWLARRRDRTYWLSVRWLVAGAGLALLPVLGSFLSSRLVLPASLGFFALVGTAVAYAARATAPRRRSAAARAIVVPRRRSAAALPRAPLIHGALAVALVAFVLLIDVYRAGLWGRQVLHAYRDIARSLTVWPLSVKLDDADAASQRVVLITADDQEAAPFFSFVRYGNGKTMPKAFWMLSGARSAHELKRIDANTIELHVLAAGEALQSTFLGSQTRAMTDPMHVGDHFDLPGMRVDVLELLEGQPVRMRYRFDVVLEDRSLVFVQSVATGLRHLELPKPGQTLVLPPPVPPDYRKAASVVAPPPPAGT